MTIDEQLNRFDEGLRKLTVEYDIFFAGGKRTPPTNLRFQIDQIVKRLLEERLSFAQRFRYNQLMAKFSVYKDLWRRQIQEKEEKGILRSEEELQSLVQPENETAADAKDYFRQPIDDPQKENGKVLMLYQELQTMRLRNGEKKLKMDVSQFRDLISQKLRQLREKQKQEKLEFVVFLDQETQKVKLVARPDKNKGGANSG
jgi:hypothetical protein